MNKSTVLLIIFTSLLPVSFVYAYDPPEIIGILHGTGDDTLRFGEDFCCIGDQNGDGYDDLLVNHFPYEEGRRYNGRVELFFGGEEVDNEPDLIFMTDDDGQLGPKMNYLGDLTGEGTSWFVFYSEIRIDNNYWGVRLYLYEGGANLDNEPDIIISRPANSAFFIGHGLKSKPADYNNDGFDDIITVQRYGDNDSVALLNIFYGGEEFDTIPDWEAIVDVHSQSGSAEFAAGEDINGDGYDDFIFMFRAREMESEWGYSVFLGGSPMDTIPAATYQEEEFENVRLMFRSFYLLPDVNGDGYADWVHYYREIRTERDGYLLFYGSEHPDGEPDLRLEGNRGILGHFGGVVGGNFNGDQYSDLITANHAAQGNEGQINLFLGSSWFDREITEYWVTEEVYGHEFGGIGDILGAIGDYNGDGIEDVVMRHGHTPRSNPYLVILAGNADWELSAPLVSIPERSDLSLMLSPNPFNNRVNINFSLSRPGPVKLNIYDTQGREVDQVLDRGLNQGNHVFTWDYHTAGVYLVALDTGNNIVVRKVVCLP